MLLITGKMENRISTAFDNICGDANRSYKCSRSSCVEDSNVAADLERLNQIWEQAWLDKEAALAENRWHMSMCTSGPTVRSSILIISVE